MKMMLLLFVSLLPSCGLFTAYPEALLEAQRMSYKASNIQTHNALVIIDKMAAKQKDLATYYTERYYLLRKKGASNEEKTKLATEEIEVLEKVFAAIDKRRDEYLERIKQNAGVVRQLQTEVYNFVSTSPLKIEDLKQAVEDGRQIIKKIRE